MPNSIMESIRNGVEAEREFPAGAAASEVWGDPSSAEPSGQAVPARNCAVIELRVRNHPGTMSHVTGLFARRAFNLDAITCVPTGDADISVMRLLVTNEPRLEQVERQLEKLHDVLSVRHRPDLGPAYFAKLADG